MSITKEDRSFKTLINRETTDSINKSYFNEFGADTINTHIDDIWAESIPYDNPTQAELLGVIQTETLFVMTLDPTVLNEQSWKAVTPPGTITNPRVQDWVSPKFGDLYAIRLFDNNDNEIFTTDPTDWFFDYQTGILTFNGNVLSKDRPFKITGYRYIGTKGININSAVNTTDLTATIDPSATTTTPPSGTIFITQDNIDDYLASQGQTAFKYAQDFIDACPPLWDNTITIYFVDGVHRPRTSGEPIIQIFQQRLSSNILSITGPPSTSWGEIHSGGTIRSHQVLKEVTGVSDPYIDCDPSTFPNDGSLRGSYAVLSNGLVSIIWEHTDSRLWLCDKLSPEPIDDTTTVSVRRPSAILRNSLDDISRAHYYVIEINMNNPRNGILTYEEISNLMIQDFSASIPIYVRGSQLGISNTLLDKTYGPVAENSNGVYIRDNAYISLQRYSSLMSVPTAGADRAVSAYAGGKAQLQKCYIQGGDDGCICSGIGSLFYITSTVFRGGGGNLGKGSVYNVAGGSISGIDFSSGVINTFVDTPSNTPALTFNGMGPNNFDIPQYAASFRFINTGGSCIRLEEYAIFDVSQGNYPIIDGGGNLDVGIDIIGPYASVKLNSLVSASGAVGDLRIDGLVGSYADLLDVSPLYTNNFNLVEKVS